MPVRRSFRTLTLALAGFVAVGCGPSEPKRYGVTGAVTYKGAAIPNGTITFTPDDPAVKSAGGTAIKDGKFMVAARFRVSQVDNPPGWNTARLQFDLPPGVGLAPESQERANGYRFFVNSK